MNPYLGRGLPARVRHAVRRLFAVAEAERLFAGISEGGKVTMPLEKTFWAERFGMCTDRFGVSWMVNCEMRAPERL